MNAVLVVSTFSINIYLIPRFKMSIHSLNSLVYSQSYFNTLNSLKDQLNEILGHRRASMWLDLWRISHSGKLIIKEAYSYLAGIWKCCRRTAIRNIKAMEEMGFVIRHINKLKFNLNAANDYRVCTPNEVLKIIKGFYQRRQNIPNIDYSVQYDHMADICKLENEVKTTQDREIPKEGDTRDLLDMNIPQVKGSIGSMLDRIKERLRSKKHDEIEQVIGGGGDTSVTEEEIDIKIYNKSEPKARPMSVFNTMVEEKEPPRIISDDIKRAAWSFIQEDYYISDKQKVYREFLFFAANNHGFTPNYSLNVFRKLIRQNKWSTPKGMRNIDLELEYAYRQFI
jgi:hypothetical protein